MDRKKLVLASLYGLISTALMGASLVHAALLLPGTSVTPVPNTTGIAGNFLADETQPFSFVGDTGTVHESVIQTTAGNPFGVGDLAFIYQVTVTTGDVEHISNQNFAGFSVDVTQFSQAGGGSYSLGVDAPTQANRTADGSVISFDWPAAGAITSATSPSYTVIVSTNATQYGPGTIGLIDGGAETLNGFAPAVPEPASLGLLSVAALGMLRRRRA